jgi:predicted RNase H-like nuclease (RuvC/YqgF family)
MNNELKYYQEMVRMYQDKILALEDDINQKKGEIKKLEIKLYTAKIEAEEVGR